MTTWSAPCWVTLDSTDQTELTSSTLCAFSMLKVNTTSAAVIGLPSCHLTPGRMVKVSFLLLSLQTHLVASQGVSLALCSVLTNTSGSDNGPRDRPVEDRLNGV